MKLHVTYKAKTNYMNVMRQAKRLRFSLNMARADITDRQEMWKDVTELGHWGSLDVEVRLRSLEELPYVMGLVRQSYERQMGEGGEA